MWLSKSARSLNRAIYPVSRVTNSIGLIVLTVMMLLMVADVITRYVLNIGLPGAYELIEFSLAIVVSLGLAYAALRGEHLSVDIIISRFSQRTQAVINSITCFLGIGLFSLITWQIIISAGKFRESSMTSPILSIPVYPFVYIVVFGSALLCMVFIKNILDYLNNAFEGLNWRKWSGLLVIMILVTALLISPIWGKDFLWEMRPIIAGIFGIGILLVLIFSGMQVGIVMGLVGFLGFIYISDLGPALTTIGLAPYRIASHYSFSIIPLFLLMGVLCFYSGLSRDLYFTTYRWLGQLPGGLAMASVGACAGFAAVCGSSIATVATMGTVALPEMKRYKYHDTLATGCIAAGGSIGILIPPSIFLVIYGIITEQSIGRLFLAGFIPGILEAVFYIITIYILCKHNPSLGPKGERTTIIQKFTSLKGTWGVFALFALVIGGIYMGIFTPTEAAGVGAFGAFLFALGRRKLTWKNFVDSLIETGQTTGMVFLILIGADILSNFLAVSRLPFDLSNYVAALPVSRYIILAVIMVFYLFLGAIMSAMAMIVITVPVFFPVVVALGFDPIWFGIIIVRLVEMGQITPPVGMNVYVMRAVAKDIPMYTIFKGVIPFLIADVLHITLLITVPQTVLLLPNLMR